MAELRRQFEAVSQTLGYRTLEAFSGSDVWQLKVILHSLGFFHPHEVTLTRGPDSEAFTPETAEAVDRFRASMGLSIPSDGSPSGLVDRATVRLLWSALEDAGRAVETRKLLAETTAIRN
jgi:peptidoglycan hydrolase-like protein with peptidoglycan-binding domain